MSDSLPGRDDALRELLRRQLRAVVWLAVRIVLFGMVSASVVLSSPWWREHRALLDIVAGIGTLWPLWTAVSRNWAWRTRLGRAYLDAGRVDDALVVLQPLDGFQGSLFDATGDGRRWLSEARERRDIAP